jgi:hypothetical protein
MKLVLKLEELAMFLMCIGLLYFLEAKWWLYPLLILGPDISMIGYLINNKAGAWSYNIFHHKGIACVIILIGLYIINNNILSDYSWLIYVGVILLGHSSMDRFFGYGLKYENGFKFTHLGEAP